MADLEIIDVHNHVYQTEELGRRNQEVLGVEAPAHRGTVDELLQLMQAAGISQSVVLLYISAGRMYERRAQDLPKDRKARDQAIHELREMLTGRIVRFNSWGLETWKKHPQLLPFIGVDPVIMSREAVVNELEDKHRRGARGVKINPGNMGIYLNDPRLWPVYEFCDRTGLPLLTQSGAGGMERQRWGWDPKGRAIYLKYALAEFKHLKVITAHFNRGCDPRDVVELAKFPGFFTDLSTQVGHWGEPGEWSVEEGVGWIRKAGADHVVFGSNYLMHDPVQFAAALRALPMSSNDLEKIAGGNFKSMIDAS
jgi:predicted TIM-barrel fold metal-dependent hydrolase